MPDDDPDRPSRHAARNQEQLIQSVAEKAAKEAVASTFALLGIDIKNQEAVNRLRDDLAFSGRARAAAERRGSTAVTVLISTVITSAATAIIAWATNVFSTGKPH